MSSSNSFPLCVGLTGGIGCGKTTVLQLFSQRGVPCFVADEAAARYYDDPAFCRQVDETLGGGVLLADGSIDKRKVAAIVFQDKERLALLNALVHPRVMAQFQQWRSQQHSPYVVFESAILYEYGLDRATDFVVSVYLEAEERFRRLMLRDAASRQELQRRMDNQLSAEEKMMRADFVILNYEGNPRPRQVTLCEKAILEKIKH